PKAAGEAYPWTLSLRPRASTKQMGLFQRPVYGGSGSMPCSFSFFLSVLRLIPRKLAARTLMLFRARMLACVLAHAGAREGLLHEPHHEPVQVGRGLAAHTAHALHHLPLDDLLEGCVGRHSRLRGDAPDE